MNNDYIPTCELKWVNENKYHPNYRLMQKFKCRFSEKSLPDIWIEVPHEKNLKKEKENEIS